MNKTAIKNFAISARKKLIAMAKDQAGIIGITVDHIADAAQTGSGFAVYPTHFGTQTTLTGAAVSQRASLVHHIQEKGYESTMEEVAYTWFNRLIAVRFMEVNDYLPTRVRVLSSEREGKQEPDLVTEAPKVDLNFTDKEVEEIYALKDDPRKSGELFKKLFIKQCNALGEILPKLFEKTADYTELLLDIAWDKEDGMVQELLTIDEADFLEAVEIIGWMYQYYISEPKDILINARSKYKRENIPFVTQLFTSDWIVQYMVDNSLGRYWIEHNSKSKLSEKLDFLITPKSGDFYRIEDKAALEELTFFDPCMGSGHILVYAFDVLIEIYRECGYADKDAVQSILENNLFGTDIDLRAYQLSYFSLMMKARSYDRRFFSREVTPQIYYPLGDDECSNFGSLLKVDELGEQPKAPEELTLFNMDYNVVSNNWNFKRLISQKYTIICTNPPYMNGSYMPAELKKYIETEYKDCKSDMFSAFIVRELQSCKENGYVGMLTPYVWMFISSYEKLREYVLSTSSISSLVQLEYNAFEGACVPVCSFVLKKTSIPESGEYIKLSDFKGIEVQAPKTLEAIKNPNCGYRYVAQQKNFSKIPGSPIAYWVNDQFLLHFGTQDFTNIFDFKRGIATGDNNRFLRLWFEVSRCKINFNTGKQGKWFQYNKGGDFRKWYGNREYVINWEDDGAAIKSFIKDGKLASRPQNIVHNFEENISYSSLTSGLLSFRHYIGFINDQAGNYFVKSSNCSIQLGLALLNSKVATYCINLKNSTLNTTADDFASIPLCADIKDSLHIDDLEKNCEEIAKSDWDSYETSWDFKRHPLV